MTAKFLMLLGGMIGFLIGISLGLAQQSAWPSILWRSSIAAFGAGILLRWWGQIWMKSLVQAQNERLAKTTPAGEPRSTKPLSKI